MPELDGNEEVGPGATSEPGGPRVFLLGESLKNHWDSVMSEGSEAALLAYDWLSPSR